jgi:phage baseplate assembly protein W
LASSINIKYPLTDDPTTNQFFQLNQTTKNAYSSDLLLLLLTNKGERYYDPNYGTNLIKFVFDQNDQTTTSNLEENIRTTVSQYIPDLTIQNITFTTNLDDPNLNENQINVKINFTYAEGSFIDTSDITITF